MSIEIYLKPILGVGGVYFKGETIFVLVISLLSVFGFLPLNQKTKSWIPPPPPSISVLWGFGIKDASSVYTVNCLQILGDVIMTVKEFVCLDVSSSLTSLSLTLFISVITELQLVLSIDQSICKLPHVYAPVGSHNIMKQRVNIPLYLQVFFVVFDSSKSTCVIYLIWQGQITYRYFTSSGHKRGASGGGRWPCQRRSLYVKFRDLGWQVKVFKWFS